MEKNYSNNRILVTIYVFLMATSLFSIYNAELTSLKIMSVIFVCISACVAFFSGNIYKLDYIWNITKRYLIFLSGIALITTFIWIYRTESVSNILRGYEKIGYQVITICVAGAAVYMFGKKSIDYTVDAFILFNVGALCLALSKSGIQKALEDVNYFIRNTGDAKGFMKLLELHDSSFVFGFFILYYIFFEKKTIKTMLRLMMSITFFIIGFKRIAIAALSITMILVCILYLIKDEKVKSHIMSVCGIIMCILGFLYIIGVRLEFFQLVTNEMEINTMGRNELYQFIEPYYNISPFFIGRGFEFITQLFKTETHETLNLARIGALHNGFLTNYIELGFFGFWYWIGFRCIYLLNWIEEYGIRTKLLYFVCTFYISITYLTDNTVWYFFTSIVLCLIPMAYAYEQN